MPGRWFRFSLIKRGDRGLVRKVFLWLNNSHGSVNLASLLVVFLLIVSFVLIITVVQNPKTIGDLRSRAWSGVTINKEILESRLGLRASLVELLPQQAKSQDLFWKLAKTYSLAETAQIQLPGLNIRGQARFHYDPVLDKSFLFSRIENVPPLEGRVMRTWLFSGADYLPVGIGEFVREGELVVAYSVFVTQGDVRSRFGQLVFSFEQQTQTSSPSAQFLQLTF